MYHRSCNWCLIFHIFLSKFNLLLNMLKTNWQICCQYYNSTWENIFVKPYMIKGPKTFIQHCNQCFECLFCYFKNEIYNNCQSNILSYWLVKMLIDPLVKKTSTQMCTKWLVPNDTLVKLDKETKLSYV
jgi:hypothetical protein